MIPVICTSLLALALLVALLFREWAFDRERQALLDRIQAPAAASAAAVERFLPAPEPVEEPAPVYVPTTDPDLRLLEEIA